MKAAPNDRPGSETDPSPRPRAPRSKKERLPAANGATSRERRLRALAIGLGVLPVVGLVGLRVTLISYKIPSGAMIPSILIGDHIFARRGGSTPPARGEIIVFEFPENRAQDFINRTIAQPGDRLVVLDGRPILNGWAVPHCKVGLYGAGHGMTLYLEFLGDRTYGTLYENEPLDTTCKTRSDCGPGEVCEAGLCGKVLQGPYRVPEGKVYVMGDNRNNTYDSRSWFGGDGGGVPFDHIHAHGGWVWMGGSGAGNRTLKSIEGPPILPAREASLQGAMDRCLRERPPLEKTTPPPPT